MVVSVLFRTFAPDKQERYGKQERYNQSQLQSERQVRRLGPSDRYIIKPRQFDWRGFSVLIRVDLWLEGAVAHTTCGRNRRDERRERSYYHLHRNLNNPIPFPSRVILIMHYALLIMH